MNTASVSTCSANEPADLNTECSHRGDDGVAQDMAKNDAPWRQALCACGNDEIARHGFRDAGREETCQHRRGSNTKRDARQRHRAQVLQRVGGQRDVATRRQPAELNRHNDLQQQTKPEHRHGDHRCVEHIDSARQPAPRTHANGDARGDADQQRYKERAQGQLDGDGEALADQARHRVAADQRLSQVPAHQAAKPQQILHWHRLIEVKLMAQCRKLRRCRTVAQYE